MSTPISPSDDDLKSKLVALKTENPTLGIPKLHALLLAQNTTWTVSEKRVKKTLQAAGLVVQPPAAKNSAAKDIHPSSELVQNLDVTKWSSKIEVKYFGKNKGKGLVAKEPIAEGEVIWKEDPFIVAPEWDIYDMQQSSRACAFCTTPLSESALVVRCPASTSAAFCPARFCSRLCLSRSARIHPLLCPAQNPASVPLLTFARRAEWMALHAVAHCAARLLLAEPAQQAEDWAVFRALAVLGMEERAKSTWFAGEPDRATWKRAHQLLVQAFQTPATPEQQKKLARVLKRAAPPDIAAAFFTYDGFLRSLGRMSLNLEAHGGLYTLHSHLNHACTPTVSVRHLDPRTALARITLLAKRDLAPGDELLVTYVDPSLGLRARREGLGAWGFGVCRCERCVEEEKAGAAEGEGKEAAPAEGMEDLERELKAGLGVM
ncbi:SET domain-containing protein [Dentipellis sp. KUC8613]|nr:SET domain-containing protein [Dentipellis sp. KUC8613]